MESSVNETNNSGGALNRISGFITNISNMNASIAAVAKQKNVTVGDINRNVSSINDISQHHSGNTQKIVTSNQKLLDLSSHLVRIFEKFHMTS